MREADTGGAGGGENAQRHFRRIGIGSAIGLMVQVMEFGNMAETALQHLHVELCGDRLDIVGVYQPDGAIHFLAPGPEAVVAAAGDLGKAGHGTLEGVGMKVGDCRDQRASRTRVAIGGGAAGFDRCNVTRRVERDRDVLGPAAGQERPFCKDPVDGKSGHVHFPVRSCIWNYRYFTLARKREMNEKIRERMRMICSAFWKGGA